MKILEIPNKISVDQLAKMLIKYQSDWIDETDGKKDAEFDETIWEDIGCITVGVPFGHYPATVYAKVILEKRLEAIRIVVHYVVGIYFQFNGLRRRTND